MMVRCVSSLLTSPSQRQMIGGVTLVFASLFAEITHADAVRAARWYRTYDAGGAPLLSSTISERHLQRGYDVLDHNMQVIRHVNPYKPRDIAAERAQQAAQRQQTQRDQDFKRTYGSSEQMMTLRNRKLNDAAKHRQSLLTQLSDSQILLQQQIAQAAVYERQGRAVPANIARAIEQTKRQIVQLQSLVVSLERSNQRSAEQLNATIERLQRLESH